MENRRNNIIRALRAEQNQNMGDGKNEFRKKAFNKHIRAMTHYNKPIITMNNVEKAYDAAQFEITPRIKDGRPYGIVEETVLYPIHHIKSIPMEVPNVPSFKPMSSKVASPLLKQDIRRRSVKQVPKQVPIEVPIEVPRRRSMKQVSRKVLPKGQRRAQSVKQKKPTGKKDYKKDILIRLLELQAVEHGNGKDDRRKKAFQRHINAIMKFPYEIETIEDLRTIYRKAHLPTHGIAYKAIHTLLPLKNITRRKQVVYQPSSFL